MGMSVGAARQSGGKRRARRHQPISEINVTPFVDVMLVLLIIFMVTAPLLTVGVQVDLPKTDAGPVNVETQPITLTINGKGQIFIQESEITLEDLTARLVAVSEAREQLETRIFIKGDATAPYEIVAQVLGKVSSAGFKKFTMSSLPSDS